MSRLRSTWNKSLELAYRYTLWSDSHLPRGVRAALGLMLAALGVLGFLPVLGFWMVPLGAALIALDVPPWRRRLLRWMERRTAATAKESSTPG
jgi:hypothetical protein